jgi:hypothetical protein
MNKTVIFGSQYIFFYFVEHCRVQLGCKAKIYSQVLGDSKMQSIYHLHTNRLLESVMLLS